MRQAQSARELNNHDSPQTRGSGFGEPQFEVGKAHISKNGLVKDTEVQHAICEQIRATVTTLGWTVSGIIASPITGGDGNQEFLLCATRKKASNP